MAELLDELDIKILNYIIENEKLDAVNIAKEFKIIPKTVYDRITRLKERKIIEGIYAKINSQNCGYVLEGFIFVKLIDNSSVGEFIKKYECANITSSFIFAGIYDLGLIVKYRKPMLLSEFVNKLKEDDNVDFADLLYIQETKRESFVPFPLTNEE